MWRILEEPLSIPYLAWYGQYTGPTKVHSLPQGYGLEWISDFGNGYGTVVTYPHQLNGILYYYISFIKFLSSDIHNYEDTGPNIFKPIREESAVIDNVHWAKNTVDTLLNSIEKMIRNWNGIVDIDGKIENITKDPVELVGSTAQDIMDQVRLDIT